mmetsp:Transcript_11627/g.27094  ORF Transcript_11627/g.27094 Transcript_11627/m.27094 type:complete len:166 (+) Transcript_11627:3-500(+)
MPKRVVMECAERGSGIVEYTARATSKSTRMIFAALFCLAVCILIQLVNWSFWPWLNCLCCLVLGSTHLSFSVEVLQESLLVVKDLGVQRRVVFRSGREEVQLLQYEKIESAVINEGIVWPHVQTYLAFVLKDEPTLALAFQHHIPATEDLIVVATKCRNLLFDED